MIRRALQTSAEYIRQAEIEVMNVNQNVRVAGAVSLQIASPAQGVHQRQMTRAIQLLQESKKHTDQAIKLLEQAGGQVEVKNVDY